MTSAEVQAPVTTVESTPKTDLKGEKFSAEDATIQQRQSKSSLLEAESSISLHEPDVSTEEETSNNLSTSDTTAWPDYSREIAARSLSPMDIESTTTTPEASPVISIKHLCATLFFADLPVR